MLTKRTILFVHLLLIYIEMVFGGKCNIPVQIPEISDIISHADTISTSEQPDFGCSVTFNTTFPIVDVRWQDATRDVNGGSFLLPIRDGERGKYQTYFNSRNLQRASLHSEGMIYNVLAMVTFDTGCMNLIMDLYLVLNRNRTFNAFPSSKLIKMPKPEKVFAPEKPFTFRIVLENGDPLTNLYYYVYSYRTESTGLTIVKEADGFQPPILRERIPNREPPREQYIEQYLQEERSRVTIPKGYQDVTVIIGVERVSPDVQPIMFKFRAGLHVTYHTGERTTPIYNISQCHDLHRLRPFTIYDEEDDDDNDDNDYVVLLPQLVGLPGCINVIADGNPAPEIALSELQDNRAMSSMESFVKGHPTVNVDKGIFYTSVLHRGQILNYKLVVNAGDEFQTQKVRIEAYVAVKVSVPDRLLDLTDRSQYAEFHCSVEGEYNTLGLYYTRGDVVNPSTWKELTVQYPETGHENGTITKFNIAINRIPKPDSFEQIYLFCAAKTRYADLYDTAVYKHNLTWDSEID